ncbi:MAG: hypothetical protein O2890_14600, partial [Cyanobacteria bacterium]|nr:hypothetical protein [Cyanobacteriota bacterium]
MTQILAIARRRPVTIVVSAVCLATALGAGLRLWAGPSQNVASIPTETEASATETSARYPEAESFEKATVSVAWRLQSLSPQYLFPSTPRADRESGIIGGRADPYSRITQGGIAPRPQTTPTAAVNTTPSPTNT